MRFEYFLLLVLSGLPLIYKSFFWGSIFHSEKYSIKNFFLSFKNSAKRESYHHFWNYIEFPLFFFAFSVFYYVPLEIFVFNFTFYTLILYNIFVLGKICRWNFQKAWNLYLLAFVLLASIFTVFCLFKVNSLLIYVWILTPLVWMPLYYMIGIKVWNLVINLRKKWKK